MTERYAVYFSPSADSELGQFGQSVLCRSADCVRQADASSTFADQNRWRQLTEKPAHYGFHATLKAPFELKEDYTVNTLMDSVSEFATSQTPIELTSLYPRTLGGYMALTLSKEIDHLSRLALNCVQTFEQYRKALSDADIKRRKLQALSGRQGALLLEYGYPYVADEFRFHLTLTSKLDENDEDYENWVISEYEKFVSKTPTLDRISVFTQADRQTPFVQIEEVCFTG